MSKLRKKILLVEDEEPFISALSDKLHDEGFTVVVARDGEEGLYKAKTENPDLILLDIVLPKMDGITMAKKLKEYNIIIPIVYLTNLSDQSHISDALETGYNDYLVKTDWNINDLMRRIGDVLDKKN